MCKGLLLLGVLVCSTGAFGQQATEGSLYAVDKSGASLGACPLKTTAVHAEISGFISRVNVRQEFENAFSVPIEAVYVFPLSHNGAVDDMKMTVGSRVIQGKIMKRAEARDVYETAKREGKAAGLLDQERANIFTQYVANIMPGEHITVEISYVETLKYEDGAYEFVFPMTVAPRYNPGGPTDAGAVSPPVASRAGHDVSIEMNLNAGVPVEEIRSTTHEIDQVNLSPNTARINLRDEKIIPNKDFILRYDVTGKRIEDAVLTHRDERGGFFTLILQPPDRITSENRTPKEIVFVLDTSGSMSGFPIEKAKEAMRLSLDGLYPEDTFNLITFAGDTAILFDKPVPATRANLDAAQEFLAERQGYGGTEMMKAIKAALEPSDASDHLRVVCFMTDGEVGNDDEIVAEVQRHPKARVFSFGIGSSVNRSLLDRIAHEGRGEAEYVALTDDGSLAAKRFYERVRSPLLTDLSVEWNGLPVSDVYPGRLTDLFSAKPVIIHGRYDKGASGTIKLRGNLAGQPYERNIKIDLPETSAANDALASLWARTRIDDLTSGLLKAQTPARATELQQQITSLALKYRLMTEYTSFVAVEDNVVNPNGAPVTIKVPVQLPEGMIGSGLNAQMDEKIPRSVSLPAKVNNASTAATGASTSSASSVGISATVDVSAANSSSIDTSSTAVSTTISSSMLSSIPIQNSVISGSGVGYGSGNGVGSGSEVEGASGTESTFIIDGQEAVAPPPPTRNTTPNVMSAGVLTGRAIKLPKPAYPAAAQAVNAQGSVVVQLLINEDGSVASARALSGHPLLRAASEKAAALATFTPVLISGKAVKVTGVVTYNFSKGKNRGIRFNKMKVTTAAPADLSASRAEQKLHVWLYAIVERLRKGGTSPTPNEATFVHDGKAEVAIELTSRSPEVLEKLKASGFELTGEKEKFVVTGMIALDQLGALADIGEVDLVLPVMR